uniref:F-box/SPRY domain-containing protein 1 n=1 Tax=Junco hyemalis TaxID=40217 RepID=A0A8C5JRP9_JUNHY
MYANHLHVQPTGNQALRPLRSEGNRRADVGVPQGPADFLAFQVHNLYGPRVIGGSQQAVGVVHRQAVDLLLVHVEALQGLLQGAHIQHADGLSVGRVQRAGPPGREHHRGHVLRLREPQLSHGRARPVRAFHHAFSTNDCSRNVYIKKNGFTLHRNPIAQSTDGARTKIGFSEGRHAWEVWWEGPLGTVAVIGIATKRAPMQCQGYVALLGSDDQSWGWNLVDNNLLHNGEVNGSFPQCNNAPKYQIGERIRVILDMEDKTLAFERGYEFLGVAFRGLPKVCLYPAVSAVYGNTEVTLVYLGKPLDG